MVDTSSIRWPSLALVALMYLQIVFGALMRHKELPMAARTHVLLAFAVVALAVWLGFKVMQTQDQGSLSRRVVWLLWALLAVQLVLGLETMLSKFEVKWGYTLQRLEPLAQPMDLIRSLHFLVGALSFSTAVSIALMAHRQVVFATRPSVARHHQLEGAL
jgi:hypothetical protein